MVLDLLNQGRHSTNLQSAAGVHSPLVAPPTAGGTGHANPKSPADQSPGSSCRHCIWRLRPDGRWLGSMLGHAITDSIHWGSRPDFDSPSATPPPVSTSDTAIWALICQLEWRVSEARTTQPSQFMSRAFNSAEHFFLEVDRRIFDVHQIDNIALLLAYFTLFLVYPTRLLCRKHLLGLA